MFSLKVHQMDVVGMMSGTSLDGLDLACCRFTWQEKTVGVAGVSDASPVQVSPVQIPEAVGWRYEILAAETIPYPVVWENRLRDLQEHTPALSLSMTHVELGHWMGRQLKSFVEHHYLHPQYAASHGHTVFHQPECHMTLQIGDPASIAAESGLSCVADFRSGDVALGGQGAPIVPIGDALLFADYDACLNIGGISNISFDHHGHRVAFDVAPANMVLNHLARREGFPYDKDGRMAAAGQLLPDLMEKLNTLDYYRQPAPKSLGKEWVEQFFLPILPLQEATTADLLATVTAHLAFQIAKVCRTYGLKTVLMTGGGAKNRFLGECLQRLVPECRFEWPSVEVVDYKEALIFAFLGLLRVMGMDNCLHSVTGASRNHCGGAIYLP